MSHLMRCAAPWHEPILKWALHRRVPARDGKGRRRCHGKTRMLASADPAPDDWMAGGAIEKYTGAGTSPLAWTAGTPARSLAPASVAVGAGGGPLRYRTSGHDTALIRTTEAAATRRKRDRIDLLRPFSARPLETVRGAQFQTHKVSLLPACGWQGTYGVAPLIL